MIGPHEEVDGAVGRVGEHRNAGLHPGDVDDRQVVERHRVPLEREPTALGEFGRRAEVDHRADAERIDHVEIVVGEVGEPIGPEEPAVAGDPAVGDPVSAEVTDVVRTDELDPPPGVTSSVDAGAGGVRHAANVPTAARSPRPDAPVIGHSDERTEPRIEGWAARSSQRQPDPLG